MLKSLSTLMEQKGKRRVRPLIVHTVHTKFCSSNFSKSRIGGALQILRRIQMCRHNATCIREFAKVQKNTESSKVFLILPIKLL